MDNAEYIEGLAPQLPPKECISSLEDRNGNLDIWRDERELSPRRPPLPPKQKRHSGDLNRSSASDFSDLNATSAGGGRLDDLAGRAASASLSRSSVDLNRNSFRNGNRPNLSLDLTGVNGSPYTPTQYARHRNVSPFEVLLRQPGNLSGAGSNTTGAGLPDKRLPTGDIADRVNKFEMMVASSTQDYKETSPRGLWFYKDGLRSPTSPPPTSAKLVLNAVKSETSSSRDSDKSQTCTVSLTLSPSCNRRQIEVDSSSLMTQSLTSLASSSNPTHSNLMTSSMHASMMTSSPSDKSVGQHHQNSFSSNICLTPLHSESRQDSSASRTAASKPLLPPRAASTAAALSKVNGVPPRSAPSTGAYNGIPPRSTVTNGGAPPLPPKQWTDTPPPRPASKELKLDDILNMCAEYEQQIEAEQRVALSLSFTSTPVSKTARRLSNVSNGESSSIMVSPFSLDSLPLSPPTNNNDDLSSVTPMSPLSKDGGGLFSDQPPPLSPTSTLTQSRIKTNGSLPRDGKRLPSPARSLPPTSPHSSEADLFTWEQRGRSSAAAISPSDPTAGSPGCYLTHPTASPRTRIKTIVGKGSRESSAETLRAEGSSCNGSPAHTLQYRSPTAALKNGYTNGSPAYSDAKQMNGSLVNGVHNGVIQNGYHGGQFSNLNNSQNSGTTKMPTSFSLSDYQGGKEDLFDSGGKTKEELYTEAKDILDLVTSSQFINRTFESVEKSQLDESVSSNCRMIIGTGMLGQNRNGNLEDSIQLSKLRTERDETILEVSRTAQQLAEIELQIEEANRSVDMENCLLGAELSTQLCNIEELRDQSAVLRRRELEMREKFTKWRESAAKDTEVAKAKLNSLEAELEQLETLQKEGQGLLDTDKELELLEKIKIIHEKIEGERRHFEDLEFQQMEVEAGMEADREEVLRMLEQTEERIREAETEVMEVQQQQQEISYSQEGNCMEDQKDAVSQKLKEQQLKLSQLEDKLSQLLVGNRRSNDSGTITWSDEETTLTNNITNKTDTVERKGSIIKSTYLNSAGSGEDSTTDSTSDLPQDSSSTTPSPNVRRFRRKSPSPPPNKRLTKRSSMQRASDRFQDNLDGLTSADESRPMSTDLSISIDAGGVTDVSSWVGEGVIMRQGAGSRATRPLTRYLPVTSQENFDLRSHIETAGHQIELCKHIVLNSCSCRGYLSKMGARLKVWTKRWFVFDRNKRTLVYYNDKSENKVKGGIYFHSISEVYVDHQNNRTANQRVTFVMKTQDRSYLLMAPTPEAMRIWVDVIFTGAEGYREYQNLD